MGRLAEWFDFAVIVIAIAVLAACFIALADAQTPLPGPRWLTQREAVALCEAGIKTPDRAKDPAGWAAAVQDCARFLRADAIVMPKPGQPL